LSIACCGKLNYCGGEGNRTPRSSGGNPGSAPSHPHSISIITLQNTKQKSRIKKVPILK